MSVRKEITKTFLSGKLSATLIIPIEIARRHGLQQPSQVIVVETDDGILIRKLDLDKV
ncbi:MAG: AbrB/MazE/SpoVT family DNA-binding domain-containing protein [Nitrososphaeraceae archaeon]